MARSPCLSTSYLRRYSGEDGANPGTYLLNSKAIRTLCLCQSDSFPPKSLSVVRSKLSKRTEWFVPIVRPRLLPHDRFSLLSLFI